MSKSDHSRLTRHWGTIPGGIACLLVVFASQGVLHAQDDASQSIGTSATAGVDLDAVLAKAAPETIAELKAVEERVHSIVVDVMPATVCVRVGGAQGSGVIVTADGLIMTAGHVSGTPGRTATIVFPDGTQVRGETLGRHSRMDSGLVKITEEGEWPFAEMGTSESLKDGTWVIALGHPGGYQRGRNPVVRLGRVLDTADNFVRTDCTLVGGDSGGPLFDMNGKVIGIHSRISRNLSQNFHVPVATYTETWDKLVASEEIGVEPPRLGIRGQDHEDGCLVTEVLDDLPALAGGIKVGDVITKFGGEDVQGINSLIELVGQPRRRREVEITLLRDGEEQTVTVRMR